MRHTGDIALVYIVEMGARLLYFDLILLLKLLDEQILRVLLRKEFCEEVRGQAAVELVLALGQEAVADVRALRSRGLLLEPVVNLGGDIFERLLGGWVLKCPLLSIWSLLGALLVYLTQRPLVKR